MQNKRILKMIYSALLAALVLVSTQFIRVPLPFGYLNFGDCFVILSAFVIGGSYAIAASAVGAALADVLSGYVIYAPATLAIKALMVAVILLIQKLCKGTKHDIIRTALCAVAAELIMVAGYFLYDTAIYGLGGAVASLGGNILQGVLAVIGGVTLVMAFGHGRIIKYL